MKYSRIDYFISRILLVVSRAVGRRNVGALIGMKSTPFLMLVGHQSPTRYRHFAEAPAASPSARRRRLRHTPRISTINAVLALGRNDAAFFKQA